MAFAYGCLRRAHPNLDISFSACFEAETWLVSTDLLPVGGVSPDLKNANVDLDCINARFGSVIILDQGILSSAVDPEGGVWGAIWDCIECVTVKTIIVASPAYIHLRHGLHPP